MDKVIALAVMALIYIVILVIIGPYFTIWSLNTLFGLGIVYSFKTWMAVVWLQLVLHGIQMSVKKNND
jgi:hypothetical protein